MNANRIEHDLIGIKEIPKEAYYGIHSIRAKENFRISGRKVHREFIIGNDTTVTLASEAGQLELNAFAPIIFDRLFESIETLSNGAAVFYKDCIKDITVNEERCREEVENSIEAVTALASAIGYDKATTYARRALSENRNVRDILSDDGVFSDDKYDNLGKLITNS